MRDDEANVKTVATAWYFCTVHKAIGHELLEWEGCRFKQLFYFAPEPADPKEATP